ncbi:MAG: response regulator transcription factor [Steroidobacteraceae bacterium]
MTRVVIVDDHELVRRGLTESLAAQSDMKVVGDFPSGAPMLAAIEGGLACDVLLLDLSLSEGSGLDVLHKLQAQQPQIPVLILSSHEEAQFGVNVLRAGARGFISKGSDEADLLRAIRTVARGSKYVSPEMAGILIETKDSDVNSPRHDILSQREFQIFIKLAEGETATHIAAELELSVKTVSTYRTRILEKMHMSTNADIVKYALSNGLRRG